MTMFQEPVGGAGAETWTQQVPIGGEDANNVPAAVALAVSPQGIQTVRDVPTMGAATNSYFVSAGTSLRVVGKVPQRRAITLMASALGRLQTSNSNGPVGLRVPADTPICIESAAEIWFTADSAGAGAEISFWAEIDLG